MLTKRVTASVLPTGKSVYNVQYKIHVLMSDHDYYDYNYNYNSVFYPS